MAKTVRKPLEIGDPVKRRGPFEAIGVVAKKCEHWCFVDWRAGSGRNPRILDENELEYAQG